MTRVFSFLFILIGSFIIQPAKAQISFRIDEPYNRDGVGTPDNVITDSTFYATVVITSSTFEIASVQAVAEDSTFTLLYDNAWGGFRGKINVSAYSQGVKRQLKFIVRDMVGNEKIDSIGYTYAKTPTRKMLLPLPYTNAYPSLPIKFSVTGVDTLRAKVRVYFVTTTILLDTFFLPSGVFDTTININSSISGTGYVEVTVWDKYGQGYSYSSVYILADPGPYITPYYTGGQILDFNYHKILEGKNNYIYHTDSSGLITQLPNSYYTTTSISGQLTPFGALYGNIDWTPDSTYTQYYTGAAGKYKTAVSTYYNNGSDYAYVNLTDMETRTTTKINESILFESGGPFSVVAENGLLVYKLSPSFSTYKYLNGVNTAIASNIAGVKNDPQTDGNYILYQVNNDFNTTAKIALHNGISDSVLSDLGAIDVPPPGTPIASNTNYLVVNKFIAYTKRGTSGQYQLWLMDSTGNTRQVTFFGSSSYIAGLNSDGDLMFHNTNAGVAKLYYLKWGTLIPKDMGPIVSGRIVYRDSTWYKIEGRYIYKLNIDASRTVANGNRTNPASWDGGVVPLPGADVVVTNNIIIDTDVTCNTLRVVPPGSITVLPRVNVTVVH